VNKGMDTLTGESANMHLLCVCGTSLSIAEQGLSRCKNCGREYSENAVRHYSVETIHLDAEALPGEGPTTCPVPDTTDHRPPLKNGLVLGHFELVGLVGEGGMGKVYKALDTSLQRYVALKVIDPKKSKGNPERYIERLFHEARAQARINHGHVVHIYYVGVDKDYPFFAMELIDGVTLADILSEGAMPFQGVVDAAVQVTRALKHAARYDIMHGDLKPSNMLINSEGVIKLSDFGLARKISQASPRTGFAGTPNYMPPEIDTDTTSGIWGDMYMLGVSLFEMTFGRLPYTFESKDIRSKLKAHQEAPIEWPKSWPASVPYRWKDVLEKLLRKDPVERYLDHNALLQDIRSFQTAEVRPVGSFVRTSAWALDLLIATGLFVTSVLGLSELVGLLEALNIHVPQMLISASLFTVPLALAWAQATWGNTLGKKLFELHIGDRHGLPIKGSTLALRSIFQFMPLWIYPLNQLITQHTAISLSVMIKSGTIYWPTLVAFGFIAVSFLFVLFTPGGRSIHDLLFGTRVLYNLQKK
jgi:serine/threonine protein kinase